VTTSTDSCGSTAGSNASGYSSHTVDKHGIPGEVLVLLECSGCDDVNDKQRVESLLEQLMEEEIVVDAMIAQDQTQVQVCMCRLTYNILWCTSKCL